MIKRILTGLLLAPIVLIAIGTNNLYGIAFITILCWTVALDEYFRNVTQNKSFKNLLFYLVLFIPILVGYLAIHNNSILKINMNTLLICSLILTLIGIKTILDDCSNLRDIFIGSFWISMPLLSIFFVQCYFLENRISSTVQIDYLGFHYNLFMSPIIYFMLVQWSGDIGGIVFGKLFGRQLLAPAISPNKTKEGGVGYILFSTVCAVLLSYFFQVSLLKSIFFGLLVGILGQAGDLLESRWKRIHHLKDSGCLLPGHGGILDRIDSMLVSSIPALMMLIH